MAVFLLFFFCGMDRERVSWLDAWDWTLFFTFPKDLKLYLLLFIKLLIGRELKSSIVGGLKELGDFLGSGWWGGLSRIVPRTGWVEGTV